MKTVVFTGSRLFMKFQNLEYYRSRAQESGLTIVEVHAEDEAEFTKAVKHAHAIALIGRPITSHTIRVLDQCELIQLLSVGYDCVDIAAATEAGIPVCNTPAYCTDEVANHAMTLLLACTRKLVPSVEKTAGGGWDYNFAKPVGNLRGKTLGIVGLGRIGRTLAPKAAAFGMRVLAYDPYLDDDIFAIHGVDRCYELHELFSQADHVSIHARLSAETRGMIGRAQLSLMKETGFIINTARGPIWDEQAVEWAVTAGRIAGAATDVMVNEPIDPEHPFLGVPNILVTPHIAWYSEESFQRNMSDGMDEIERVLSGKRPRAIVNPEVFGRR